MLTFSTVGLKAVKTPSAALGTSRLPINRDTGEKYRLVCPKRGGNFNRFLSLIG